VNDQESLKIQEGGGESAENWLTVKKNLLSPEKITILQGLPSCALANRLSDTITPQAHSDPKASPVASPSTMGEDRVRKRGSPT